MTDTTKVVNLPIFKKRIGRVSVSVFSHERDSTKGKFTSKSVALQVSYKKDGEWVNKTLTIVRNDLPNAIQALEAAAVQAA